MSFLTAVLPFPALTLLYRVQAATLKLVVIVMKRIIRLPEVYVGPGSSLQLCNAIAAAGSQRLLIVTDAMLVNLGIVEPIRQRLLDLGVAVTIYDGVLPDPLMAQVEDGLALLKRDGCGGVLAVGGGSPIDVAKLIAARATNPSRSVSRMVGLFRIRKTPLPIYCIPTTAGTGSEVSVGAVVSDPAQQRKLLVGDHKLVPNLVALDGRLMTGLPPAITAATAMDAMTHAVEAYLSRNAIPESDRQALEAVTLIARYLPRVMANGKDEDARQMLSWAAYRAGLALSQAGLGYVHGIAHNFGALYHTPHGWANAIVLPHVLDYYRPTCATRLADLARAAGLDEGLASMEQLADRFIALVRKLKRDCGIPEQHEDLRDEHVSRIADAALAEVHFFYAPPRYMSKAVCEGVVRQML